MPKPDGPRQGGSESDNAANPFIHQRFYLARECGGKIGGFRLLLPRGGFRQQRRARQGQAAASCSTGMPSIFSSSLDMLTSPSFLT